MCRARPDPVHRAAAAQCGKERSSASSCFIDAAGVRSDATCHYWHVEQTDCGRTWDCGKDSESSSRPRDAKAQCYFRCGASEVDRKSVPRACGKRLRLRSHSFSQSSCCNFRPCEPPMPLLFACSTTTPRC